MKNDILNKINNFNEVTKEDIIDAMPQNKICFGKSARVYKFSKVDYYNFIGESNYIEGNYEEALKDFNTAIFIYDEDKVFFIVDENTTGVIGDLAKANPDEIQQMYIMTPFYTATDENLAVHLMDHLYPDMLKVNDHDDITRRLMQIQFAKFEVNSDSVRSLINQTNDALALVRQTHFQLADFEIQLSKAVDKEQKQAIKEQLYELKKQFKDVVKQGLKLVKDCCACIPKEREAIKSLGNIVKKVRLLKQAKVHSPYENSMDSMQWVKHAWGLINNP